MQEDIAGKILASIHLAENIKKELRHCWLSNNRHESVAEHSWRLAFSVLLVGNYLDKKIDMERALKMAIVHDLAEAVTGDLPVFVDNETKERKQIAEYKAMQAICFKMPEAIGDEIFELWEAYEARDCYESKVVAALDKLEAIVQHLEADPSTWTEWEVTYNQKGAMDKCEFDSCLAEISRRVQSKAREIVETNYAESAI